MSSLLYPLYTLANLGLAIWGFMIWRRNRRAGTLLLVVITAGLVYDNLILSVGNSFGSGPTLEALSIPRFVLHQLLLPWAIFTGFQQARLAGHRWACRPRAGWWAAGLAGAVMLAGVATRLIGLDLSPEVLDGVTRYVATGTVGPPIVSIIAIGFLGVVGAMLWRSHRWPWQILVVVLVFIAEGFPDESIRRGLGSAIEVLLIAVVFRTEQMVDVLSEPIEPAVPLA
jgi:hypothetical protein